ncbi:MAG: ABC transporter ATP-binding protein [Eubacterium sp.]|nr:ABC transporter ATP-binding protein [Eubacterium sp.]
MQELTVNNISKSFDGRRILRNVSFELHAGELISLLGISGGGKSTIFNIIAGLMTPDEGDVLLDGESIVGNPGRVSYMLQKDLLLPHKNMIDNISLPLVIRGMKKKEAREVAAKHLKQFGLAGYGKKHPHELSGGMRQRAALLRTYLFSGEVALLDEPFSALDTITRQAMHIWYLSVMEELKLPTVFITHDVDEAILLSDRILILGRPADQQIFTANKSSDGYADRLSGHSGAGLSEQSGNSSAANSPEAENAAMPATITHTIIIEGREKKTHDYLLSSDFLQYKKEIVDYI